MMNLIDLPDLVDTWTASHVQKFFNLNALNYGLEQADIQLLGRTAGQAIRELTRESLKKIEFPMGLFLPSSRTSCSRAVRLGFLF